MTISRPIWSGCSPGPGGPRPRATPRSCLPHRLRRLRAVRPLLGLRSGFGRRFRPGGLSSIQVALLRSAAPRPVEEEVVTSSAEEEAKPRPRPLQREELDAIRGSMDSFRELARSDGPCGGSPASAGPAAAGNRRGDDSGARWCDLCGAAVAGAVRRPAGIVMPRSVICA